MKDTSVLSKFIETREDLFDLTQNQFND